MEKDFPDTGERGLDVDGVEEGHVVFDFSVRI
jgi:hypothetical protein